MANQQTDKIIWECQTCKGKGQIDHPTFDRHMPISVICAHCQTASAYLWCSYCGISGQISETNFSKHPLQWVCQSCQQKFDLPLGFYEVHIRFTPTQFPRTALFAPRRSEDQLPTWIVALEQRWKRFGEPMMIVCVLILLMSLLGLGLTAQSNLHISTIFIFSTFLVVFSSLLSGVFVWGAITTLFKWIMLHTTPKKHSKPNF